MNILSVLATAATRTGGPPAFVGGYVPELAKAGHTMRVVSTDLALAPASPLQRQERLQRDGIYPSLRDAEGGVFPARFPRRFAYSPSLRRALPRLVREADVVHVHNLWQFPQYSASKSASKAGVPYVVSPHGSLDSYLREHGQVRKWAMTRLWQRQMLEGAALIHVTTSDEADHIADTAPDVARAIVPCGIHVEAFSRLPPRQEFRDQHLGGYEGPVVLFLGRVTYKKGVDVLIRAFAQVRRELESRLVIVGPDDEGLTRGLRAAATDLGVRDDVMFTGPLYDEDRLAALSAADVWTLSSHTENFGIAVIEAMAASCPVVISPGVSLAGAVAAAEAGIVADLDPQRFADGILEVLTTVGRSAQLAEAGRQFAARYDWSVLAPELAAMYRTAILP